MVSFVSNLNKTTVDTKQGKILVGDLKADNVMKRLNGELVFIDPINFFSNRHSAEKAIRETSHGDVKAFTDLKMRE